MASGSARARAEGEGGEEGGVRQSGRRHRQACTNSWTGVHKYASLIRHVGCIRQQRFVLELYYCLGCFSLFLLLPICFYPFLQFFNYFCCLFACCSCHCCRCCCFAFRAFSSPSIYCAALLRCLPFAIHSPPSLCWPHYSRFLLATWPRPQPCYRPFLSPPLQRLSHLTLCVFSNCAAF